jgi:hypothetical protein
MAYGSSTDGGFGAGASYFHGDASQTDRIDISDAELLFRGHFARSGPDLVLTGQDGHHHIIPGYFASEHHPTLYAPNGAHLSGDLVDLLAGSPTPGHYAQAQQTLPADAIGKVEKVVGDATVQRNGTAVTLHVGDAVFKSDVIETGDHSSVGIAFVDGTALDLVASTRMALNEYIYDVPGAPNNALFTLVEGTFAFVAGKVAHTGNGMQIATPVATMGIRGTVGLFKSEPTVVNANLGHVWSVFLHEDIDGSHHLGRIALVDQDPNSPTFGQVFYLLDSSDYIAYLEPRGSGQPPNVRLEPITSSRQFADRHFYDDLHQIVSAYNGTNPQSGPNGGSGDNPSSLFPQQPHQENGTPPLPINFLTNGNGGDSPTTLNTNLSVPVQGGLLSNSTPSIAAPPPPSSPSTIFIWNSDGTSDWPTDPDWSTGAAPDSPIDQVIIESGTVNYDLLVDTTISSLTVDPGAILDVTSGQLTAGSLVDDGTIVVEGDPPTLVIAGPATIGSTGIMEAAGAHATLDFEGSTLANAGLVAARQGGLVDFNDEAITNESGGRIEARDRRSLVNFTNANLDNFGIVAAKHGGVIVVDGGSILNEAGAADQPSAKIVARGRGSEIDFTNVGLINAGLIGALTYGSMQFENGTVANESGATIEAVNHGTITFDADNFANDGTVLAAERGSLIVIKNDQADVDNSGIFAAKDGGAIEFKSASVVNEASSVSGDSTLPGSQIVAADGGAISFYLSQVRNLTGAEITARDHGSIEFADSGVANDGGVIAATVSGSVTFEYDHVVNENGGVIAAEHDGTVGFSNSELLNDGIGSEIKAEAGGTLAFYEDSVANVAGGVIAAEHDGSVGFSNSKLLNDGIGSEIKAETGGLVAFYEASVANVAGGVIAAEHDGSVDFSLSDLLDYGNGSELEAEAGGTLAFYEDSVANVAGGVIAAEHGGSVEFSNSELLNWGNGSEIKAEDNGTLASYEDGVVNTHGAMIVAADFGTITFDADVVTNTRASTIAATNGGVIDIAFSDVTNTHHSLIEATDAGTVVFDYACATNTGDSTIEAQGLYSTVYLEHTLVTNDGGTIAAIGSGATVELIDATIVGGTLESRDGGLIDSSAGTSTLDGVTIADGTVIQSNDDVDLKDTITVDGTATFQGPGTFTLDGPGAKIVGDAGTLDNLGTIAGAGTIGSCDGDLSLINNGTIDANVCGQTLTIGTGEPITNLGTLEAANGGRLLVDDPVTGGTALVKGGIIDFAAAADISQITFNNGAGAQYGEVVFNDPNGLDVAVNGFAGTKPTLAHSDGIALTGDWTIESETSSAGNVTLELKDGSETATFNFDSFSGTLDVTHVAGNTLITDPAPSSNSANPAVSVGGAGNDTFVFQSGVGAETITNVNPQADTTELGHLANVQEAQELAAAMMTSDGHGATPAALGHGDNLTIPGVSENHLQQHLQSLAHLH